MHTSSAKYRRWQESIRRMGCVITGDPNCVIHHPVGRSGKHNKIHIGEWFILPLKEDHHVGTPYSIHGGKKRFTANFGRQCDLFAKVLKWARCNNLTLPPDEVVAAINDWGK